MTCTSAAAASALRARLADPEDQDLTVAVGNVFIRATGTPAVQLACARAVADSAGLQFLDVLQRRGYVLMRISWYSRSRVARIERRLHFSANAAQIAVGIFVNNGREFEVGTVHVKLPQEVMSFWGTHNQDLLRAWGGTLFDMEDTNGSAVPDVYGPPGYDELAGRISQLALSGVRIKSMQYLTGEELDATSSEVKANLVAAIATQCVVEGRDMQLRFLVGEGAQGVLVKNLQASGRGSGNLLEVGDVTVDSTDAPLGDSLTAALKQSLSTAAPPQTGGK